MKAFVFLVFLAPAVWASGGEVGNGDPVPFEMPKENFAYSCDLLFRTKDKAYDFVWARRTVRFAKKDFKITGGENGVPPSGAYVQYFSQAQGGWKLQGANGRRPRVLPESLVGHQVQIGMDMGSNAGLPIPGPVASVLVDGKIGEDEHVSGSSRAVDFKKKDLFDTDVIYSSESRDLFIGLSATCHKL